MEDDIEEGAVHVKLAVVVNEAQPLPERLGSWCVLQRAYLSAAMLIDPLAGNRLVVSNGKCFY